MIIRFVYILFIIVLGQSTYACATGFACSIDNLEQMQEQQNNLIKTYIDNFFKKEINCDFFFSHPFYSENYNDLFIFKPNL